MPTISFGGIASGMDTEGIITGLLGASREPIQNYQRRLNTTQSAVTAVSDVSSLLAKLKTAVEDLDSVTETRSYSASSSSDALAISANGAALPGAFAVSVNKLATEQRTYSNTFASNSTALTQTGTLGITVGSGAAVNVNVEATDTLENVATKINASGAKVSASVFYDGSQYRLQVRGKDTGVANAVSFAETGVSFGLSTPANTFQAASNAELTVDGFTVTSASNSVSGVIPGVTMALKSTTTTPASVSVEADPDALVDKLNRVVSAYNAVISKVNVSAGFGTIKATNSELAGDSTLRGINTRLGTNFSVTYGSGSVNTARSVGLSLNNDGSIKLDSTKLKTALESNADGVFRVLAGDDSALSGVMDALRDSAKTLTDTSTGALKFKQDALETQAKDLQKRIDKEQSRLDSYEAILRKQFQAMDTSVSNSNNSLSYLTKVFG